MNTEDPPRYKIDHINDFLCVPPDRLEACLKEFAVFLAMTGEIKQLIAGLPAEMVTDDMVRAQSFVWIDDGENNVTLHLSPMEDQP